MIWINSLLATGFVQFFESLMPEAFYHGINVTRLLAGVKYKGSSMAQPQHLNNGGHLNIFYFLRNAFESDIEY
jgi:hypothetical protein